MWPASCGRVENGVLARLIKNERAPEGIERVENRRDGRSAAREKWFVTERADGEQRAGFSAPIIAMQTQIRQFIESIVQPSQEDVVGCHALKRWAQIDISVNELLHIRD